MRAGSGMALEIRLLGPTEVRFDGRRVDFGPPLQRAVLAALAVDAGRPVTQDLLIDRVWGEAPPARVRTSLHANISRIRRVLNTAHAVTDGGRVVEVVRRDGGYLLDVDALSVDLRRFDHLTATARERADDERAELLREALDLWHGPALADLPGEWPARMRAAWGTQRLDVAVEWARTAFRLGDYDQVIAEARAMITDYPLVEPLVAVLMRALTAAGRVAEALRCYASARAQLADELGADPSAELQELHQAILRGNGAEAVASALLGSTTRAVCTLPADTAIFTGRSMQLRRVITDAHSSTKTKPGHQAAIYAIDGMPGVGKTSLAVHLGHLLADRFPDRQLFLNLHAHTAGRKPSEPIDALATLLAADGVDTRFMPNDLDGRAAMWRDRTANKQVLLIFDNVAGSAQVLPLLPGTAGSLVLLTSRRHLGDLPSTVVHLPLDTLPANEAADMFLRLAPHAGTEPAKVAELVAVCGHLPLAISLVARVFTRHRTWSLDNVIAEATANLFTVSAESRTIAAVFDLSYQYLNADQQRFLRRLALHPGQDIDAYAAAALSGLPLRTATAHLEALHANHLIDEQAYHRYRMHDLIRDYTRALADTDPADERDQALRQLLGYYQHTARLADTYLTRHNRPVGAPVAAPIAAPDLGNRVQAQEWMTREQTNLLSCLEFSTCHQLLDVVIGLTDAIASHLRHRGPWLRAVSLHEHAVAAARQRGDRLSMANALTELGDIRWLTGDNSGATAALGQAVDTYRELGASLGEANALVTLGGVGRLTGNLSDAAQVLERAIDIYREIDNRLGQANALNGLGFVKELTGDYRSAAAMLEQSLDLYVVAGNRIGQGAALDNLGTVRRLTGDYPGAITVLERALEIFRDEGNGLGLSNTLTSIGLTRYMVSDYPGATTALDQALTISRELGNRLGQANATRCLGSVRYQIGDYASADVLLTAARTMFQEVGDRDGESEALNYLGKVHLRLGDLRKAHDSHQCALRLARSIHSQLEEAHALEGLGRHALATNDADTATAQLTQALDIYRRIGAAEADALAAELG